MANNIDQFTNFARSTVAGGASGPGTVLLSTDTTLRLQPGDGAKFPPNGPFMVLLGSFAGMNELTKCTSRAGDVLTLIRGNNLPGPDTNSAQQWAVNTPVSEVVSAGNLVDLWSYLQQTGFNVTMYGAVGDGVTDDTAAIQSAIVACTSAGGGIVLFPPNPFGISSTLTIGSDNVQLVGSGWETRLIPLATFSPGYPMVQVLAPATNFRYGIKISDLYLVCNSANNVSGIELDSTYGALVDHVRVRYCAGNAIYMNAFTVPQTNAYNTVRDCYITDAASTASVGVLTNIAEWIRVENSFFSHYSPSGAVAVKLQGLNCQVNGCSFDYNDTSIFLSYTGRATITANQFDRGLTQFIRASSSNASTITGNSFNSFSGSGAKQALYFTSSGNSGNIISANTLMQSSGWKYFVAESSDCAPANLYIGNEVGGLNSSAFVLVSGIARSNRGFNPYGGLASPVIPISGTAYTNSFGVDATVYITGNSVASILIGNVSTVLRTGTFRVPATQTITVYYTGSPTWSWTGD